MAVRTAIPIEEYLRTDYEHDREYVRGEVVEREMPTKAHSKTQAAFILFFGLHRKAKRLYALPELRIRLAPDLVRIPDIAVYLEEPIEEVPIQPPLAAIEILSPDERHRALVDKCRDYHRWGVSNVWIVDPDSRVLWVFNGTDLLTVPQLELPEASLTITPAEIFD
jgi:Uma2 family endonuclease